MLIEALVCRYTYWWDHIRLGLLQWLQNYDRWGNGETLQSSEFNKAEQLAYTES